jgi:predicted protein tyrosine phosphatase
MHMLGLFSFRRTRRYTPVRPLQGEAMILFVCSQGRLRSRTAELLCLFGGVHARSAGTDNDADVPLTDTLVRQATLIVCMERKHIKAVTEFAHYGACPVVQLGIPDEYDRLEAALMRDLIYQAGFHDPKLSSAMDRGRQLLVSQPGYQDALGTQSEPTADNPAFACAPQ